jgi:hypothetical protein
LKSLIISCLIIQALSPSFVDGQKLETPIFREKIEKVLTFAEIPYNDEFVKLLMGTAAVESDYGQNLGGDEIDRGVFQINVSTRKDILKRLLPKYEKAYIIIQTLDSRYEGKTFRLLEYQIILAVIYYHSRIDYKKLESDVKYLANVWKLVYNTNLGRGTRKDFIFKYKKYVK